MAVKKNIAIIGCGKFGSFHAHNLKNKCNLYFYSRTQEKAEILCATNTGKGIFNSYEEVINDSKIDAVFITSPASEHFWQISESSKSHKKILVEKPMCISSNELETLRSTLTKSQKENIMVAENYLYKPLLIQLKKDILELGDIHKAKIIKNYSNKSQGWRSTIGSLLEGGIHYVSFLNELFGTTPTITHAQFQKQNHIERMAKLELQYKDITATLEYSWMSQAFPFGIFQHSSIEGTKGKIIFESNGIYLYKEISNSRTVTFPGIKDIGGYKAMYDDFFHWLYTGSAPKSNFAHAQSDLHIVFEAYSKGRI